MVKYGEWRGEKAIRELTVANGDSEMILDQSGNFDYKERYQEDDESEIEQVFPYKQTRFSYG